MIPRHLASLTFLLLVVSACQHVPSASEHAPTVVTSSGDIRAAVESYRAILGPDNGGAPGVHASGRREINWDKVPAEFAAPAFLPSDFFNAAAAPRARGAVLTTPGLGVQVSGAQADPSGIAPRFGHVNASYTKSFATFSAERLFSPIGSHIVDLTFRVPGTNQPALVRGFGAVYTDVDTEHTAFEYFDRDGRSIGRYGVPAANEGLSFLGVAYDEAVVARVRIEYGTSALGPVDGPAQDVAVMDDFLFGEPQPFVTSAY